MSSSSSSSSETRLVQPGEAAQAAVVVLAKGVYGTAKRHKKISLTWIFGLVLTMFASGFRVTPEQAQKYEASMERAEMSEPIRLAAHRHRRLEQKHYDSKGWFWSCDAACQRNKRMADMALRELHDLQRQEALLISDVKAQVGIFSEFGVAETRERFWSIFSGGKAFAKRQSMWDLLFLAINSSSSRRDENVIGILLKYVLQLLFNFTLGLVGAFVVFVFQLYNLVFSYQPNPLTGLVYVLFAAIAAASVVATYLFAMYLCAATGATAIGAAATAQARIDQHHGGDRRYIPHQSYGPRGSRPHGQ